MMAATILLSMAASASAKPALRYVPEIDNGLFAVGAAHVIREACPDISARMFRAISFLRGLERRALELGYSKAEIEAHLDSKAEKERMKQRGRVYFAERGASMENETGLCDVGRDEISKGTAIGRLLRVTN
jgi:hypothetical protein